MNPPFSSPSTYIASQRSPLMRVRVAVLAGVLCCAVLGAGLVGNPVRPAGADSSAPGEPLRSQAQLAEHEGTPSAALPVNQLLGGASDHQRIAQVGSPDDSFFRVECSFSHFGYDDPVRQPGERASAPLQMFFGNTETTADTRYWSLIDRGDSTCSGGALDRSAYVVPAIFDEHDRAVVPSYFVVHYNSHVGSGRAGAVVQPFPEGLQLTAGRPNATSAQDARSAFREVEFSCDEGERGDENRSSINSAVLPNCDPGPGGGQSSLKAQVRFPFCWDGDNLSSSDGSHMEMPSDGFHSMACPGSHPVVLPSIEYNIFFDLPAGASTAQWKLSSDLSLSGGLAVDGGTTMHAGWWGGWNREVLNTWIASCSNVPGAHCAQGLLGEDSGKALERLRPFFGPWNPFTVATAAELATLCPSLVATPGRCAGANRGTDDSGSDDSVGERPAPSPDRPVVVENPSSSGMSYDTAWEMPHRASRDEIRAYLDHLDAAGFDGTWFSLLPFGAAYGIQPPGVGDRIAVEQGGRLLLSDAYAKRVRWILDEATARDLDIGLVVAWARANTCKNQGVTPSNGVDFGVQVARAFGDAPSLRYWVLGGDVAEAECGGTTLRDTSRALAAGIRQTGASQPIAFHTGAGRENYLTFNTESWVDVQAVQTGHCQDAATMERKLAAVVEASAKPVILAESRYYLLAPPWKGCLHNPGNPVGPSDIADDVQAGRRSGVVGQLFGDARRYQWCKSQSDLYRPEDRCNASIRSTFGTPGELAFLSSAGADQ